MATLAVARFPLDGGGEETDDMTEIDFEGTVETEE